MEKAVTLVSKAVLLVSAATMLIIRLITYKGFETMDIALRNQLNTIAYIAAGLTLVSGLVWVYIEKRHPREKESYEFIPPSFDKKNKEDDGKTEENRE